MVNASYRLLLACAIALAGVAPLCAGHARAAEEPPAPLIKPVPHVAAPAAKAKEAEKVGERKVGHVSGLPLPRFVSLGFDKVNARVGPGTNYPIAWVYSRKYLPVQIVAEYEHFRKIKDHDGAEAWVNKNQLSNRRYLLIEGGTRALRDEPNESARVAALVEPGVQVRMLKCAKNWCQVEVQGIKGYGPTSFFWGVGEGESAD